MPMSTSSSPDPVAEELARVYQELRRTARQLLRRERYPHTLESVDLVHQAWERLLGGDLRALAEEEPRKVLALAVLNMRRELVDHARKRRAAKRPDPRGRVDLDDASLLLTESPDTLLAVDALLTRLERGEARVREGARKATVSRYAFYGGLSESEIAAALELPKSTVNADLTFVKAWLATRLADG